MMTNPPKPEGSDEICPICKKEKSKHTPEEILTCTSKMREPKESSEFGEI